MTTTALPPEVVSRLDRVSDPVSDALHEAQELAADLGSMLVDKDELPRLSKKAKDELGIAWVLAHDIAEALDRLHEALQERGAVA